MLHCSVDLLYKAINSKRVLPGGPSARYMLFKKELTDLKGPAALFCVFRNSALLGISCEFDNGEDVI